MFDVSISWRVVLGSLREKDVIMSANDVALDHGGNSGLSA